MAFHGDRHSQYFYLTSIAIGLLILLFSSFILGLGLLSGPGFAESLGFDMKFGVAFGLFLASAGLVLRRDLQGNTHWKSPATVVLALATILYGAISFSRGALNFYSGDTYYFELMSPHTAFCLMSFGWGSLALQWPPTSIARKIASLLLSLNVLACSLALIGHLYGATAFYRIGSLTEFHLDSALFCYLLSLGYLCVDHQQSGLVRIFLGDYLGSSFARRLLIPAFFLPVVLGWAKMVSMAEGWLPAAESTTLLVWILSMTFYGFLSKGSGQLNQMEEKRNQAMRLAEMRANDLQKIANMVPAFISYIDREERYQFANNIYSLWFRRPLEQIIGRTVQELHPEKNYIVSKPYMKAAFAGEKQVFEQEYTNHLDQKRILKIEFIPDTQENGQVSGIFVLATDMTDISEAVKIRDEFLSIASHELRTPLTSLKLQSEIREINLEKGNIAAFDPQRVKQMIQADNRQLDRLTRLVDDMLDITRIGSGQFKICPRITDMSTLTKQVVDRFQIEYSARDLYFENESDGSVLGEWDAARVEQILSNLIINAMKYGGTGPVTVKLAEKSGAAIISIIDQGMGIKTEDLDRIFNRFERAVNENEICGLGLGLYIVREIVAAHQGTIRVESELGRGSVFTVELPVRAQGPYA